MKTIQFTQGGGILSVSLKFSGFIEAGYALKLSEKNSNQAVNRFDGDNLDNKADSYFLPTPAEENDGRILRLTTVFVGLNPGLHPNYGIDLEIYQNNVLLGVESDTGPQTGATQNSLLFVKLVKLPD
jgi:hypothetical protein